MPGLDPTVASGSSSWSSQRASMNAIRRAGTLASRARMGASVLRSREDRTGTSRELRVGLDDDDEQVEQRDRAELRVGIRIWCGGRCCAHSVRPWTSASTASVVVTPGRRRLDLAHEWHAVFSDKQEISSHAWPRCRLAFSASVGCLPMRRKLVGDEAEAEFRPVFDLHERPRGWSARRTATSRPGRDVGSRSLGPAAPAGPDGMARRGSRRWRRRTAWPCGSARRAAIDGGSQALEIRSGGMAGRVCNRQRDRVLLEPLPELYARRLLEVTPPKSTRPPQHHRDTWSVRVRRAGSCGR